MVLHTWPIIIDDRNTIVISLVQPALFHVHNRAGSAVTARASKTNAPITSSNIKNTDSTEPHKHVSTHATNNPFPVLKVKLPHWCSQVRHTCNTMTKSINQSIDNSIKY